jgi:hypothetical protein
MPERVAESIEEIARPNRNDQQEKPQIQADQALRRPRLTRSTPTAVVLLNAVAADVGAGWAVFSSEVCSRGHSSLLKPFGAEPGCALAAVPQARRGRRPRHLRPHGSIEADDYPS